jgi:enamine deaminase RidA (YjgF/YER057c/UK114 family)
MFQAGTMASIGRCRRQYRIHLGNVGLNALAVLKAELGGDLSGLKRVLRVGVFVLSDDGFQDQPLVANGASELLEKLFGDGGRHARAAVGVNALPLNATVEIEFLFEVE